MSVIFRKQPSGGGSGLIFILIGIVLIVTFLVYIGSKQSVP